MVTWPPPVASSAGSESCSPGTCSSVLTVPTALSTPLLCCSSSCPWVLPSQVGVTCLSLSFSFHTQTDLYSGALFVQVCLGWDLYLSTVLMLVVTGLYTIAGRSLSICWPRSFFFG